MKQVWLGLCAIGCAHVSGPSPRIVQAAMPPATSAEDAAFETATAELAAARFQEAGDRFQEFIDRFPADRRVDVARLQEAYAALNQLDQVRGLDRAQTILAQLSEGVDGIALRQLKAVILARAQALQAQAAVAELLSQCEGQAGSALDKERSQSRAQVGKLQQELQKREETLEQVKQRLLEIQRMASDMIGAPPPEKDPNHGNRSP
jgi:TolA-binding protein